MPTIDDEPAYPIWSVTARWTQKRAGENLAPWQTEGVPADRMRDCTDFYKLWAEDPDSKALQAWPREWWSAYKEKHLEQEPADLVAIVRFVRNETWCLTWFSHYTIDRGQSDQEALDSFWRYVLRVEANNRHLADTDPNRICLMSAEDRWRWHGTEDGDAQKRTDAPCRCKHCKEQGVIRIGH